MKKYYKFILAALVLGNCTGLFAQETEDIFVEKQRVVTFQARAGLNLSNVTASWDGDHKSADARVGFSLAALADVNLGKSFYMLTGLMFSTKGANDEDEGLKVKMNAMYLQVPLYIGYKISFPSNDNKFGIAAGPYFAYGIAGKTKLETSSGSISIDTFDKDGFWNRPDLGLGMEFSFEIKRFVFALYGEVGLTRAWKQSRFDEKLNVRNSVSSFVVGYKF